MNSTTNLPVPSPVPVRDCSSLHGIPTNVSTGFAEISHPWSYQAMSHCCAKWGHTNTINTAGDCYYWCEVDAMVLYRFRRCMVKRSGFEGGSYETLNAGTRSGISAKGVAVWALLVAGTLCLW